MRHHFYRCGHLRVLSLDASDLSGARKGGGPILEELCEARRLSPCVGLVDCDVLALARRRRLLAQRATREYGECLRCAAPIDLERLRSSPETRACAKCAEQAK